MSLYIGTAENGNPVHSLVVVPATPYALKTKQTSRRTERSQTDKKKIVT